MVVAKLALCGEAAAAGSCVQCFKRKVALLSHMSTSTSRGLMSMRQTCSDDNLQRHLDLHLLDKVKAVAGTNYDPRMTITRPRKHAIA